MQQTVLPAQPRIVYVIAAYDEAAVIGRVIGELKRDAPPGDIVLVDDGSSDDTAQAARAAGAIVLRHPINRGQGAALQTGLEAALKLGAEIAITFDADGQHSPTDVPRFLDRLAATGADVALGSRFLESGSNVPRGRRLLLRLGLVFTRLVSRLAVTDTHNGFRAFRAAALRQIHISEDRMAHASELLDLIAEAGLRYVEVPSRLRYTDYSLRKGQPSSAALRVAFDYLLGKLMR
jgi:glycosyltransferase involved in cell wall biosynthesis